MAEDPSGYASPPSKRLRVSPPSSQPKTPSVRSTKINYPKKRVSVACEVCRSRKTRCDAAKPACYFCAQLGIQCVYRRSETSDRPAEGPEGLDRTPALQQNVVFRLECIEELLLRQHGDAQRASGHAGPPFSVSPQLAAATDSSPVPAADSFPLTRVDHIRDSNLFFGIHFNGFSRLEGQPCPPALESLCTYDAEEQLEDHLLQSKLFFADLQDEPRALDLSPRQTWQLQQSFLAEVLIYCPIIDQHDFDAILVRVVESRFKETSLETALALLTLALGDFVRHTHHTDGSPSTLPGMGYFRAGRRIIDTNRQCDNTILFVQCQIFTAFYLLYALRPHLAYDAISLASTRIMVLMSLRKRLAADSVYREQCHRAYWACYLIEHELQSHIPYSSQVLQNLHDRVPLPLSNYDEPGMYWFLSEIAIRGIFSNWRNGEAWTFYTMYAPVVVEEISAQMFEWHSNLARPIAFPLEKPNPSAAPGDDEVVLKPLLDPHKVFLRAQFYALQTVVHWSSIVQLLSIHPDSVPSSEYERLVASARQSLHYGVFHVYAVESLLQDRHLMLMANITGLFCIMMLLASTYNVPELAALQHPGSKAALKLGLRCLKTWRRNPGMEDKIHKTESLMKLRGIFSGSDDG